MGLANLPPHRTVTYRGTGFINGALVRSVMVNRLSEEEIDDIIDEYQDLGNVEKVADKLGHSDKTVRKYVNEWKEEREPEEAVEEEGGFLEPGDSGGQFGKNPAVQASEDFEEFLRELDDEMGFGFKDRFVRMKVLEVKRSGELPNPGTLANDLSQYPSGVSNNSEIEWIANLYAQWIGQRSQESSESPAVSAPGVPVQGQQQGGGKPGNQHGSGIPVQQQANQYSGPQQQWNGQGAQGGPPQGQQGQMAMMMEMMEQMNQNQQSQEVEELKREIRELKEQQNGGGGNRSLSDELQELAEAKQTMEAIAGGGDDGAQTEEIVQHFQQQLQQLQQQISQSDSSGGPDLTQLDEGAAVLSLLAQQGADPDTLATLAEKVGNVDSEPEVAKKKVEKQMKEMELEQQGEKWEAIMEGLSEAASNVGGLLSLAPEGGEQEPTGGSREQQGQKQAQEQRELQRVEEQGENVSPARQRVEEMVKEAPQEPQPETQQQARQEPQPEPQGEPRAEPQEETHAGAGETEVEVDEEPVEEEGPKPAVKPVGDAE